MPIIQSVDRALRILDLFDEHTTELKITEISSLMRLNKSTVHSLLKTLQKHHYIDQDEDGGKYKLGMKLLERGNLVTSHLDIRTVARKYLLELSMKTGYTLHLVIQDGNEGVYIDKVEGTSATILYSRVGRRVSLHCSSVGKVLLAFKKKEELKQILKGYIYKKQTPNTITNEKDFLKELDQVKKEGYAIDREENEPAVSCIAVPIRNHLEEVIAAVSISMPSPRLNDEEIDKIVPKLKQVGDDISRQMGYQHKVLSS
ncbi:IclR family transcriptional regulator [Pueribacillus theae]|uniref:Glycerol operon regulatory protein n=1 Tax=Pueribacillus theae TaxID=2171751 RepID=A0A2U1JM19_9BACI|nr:IclR family transcriptional regulator [Pueribacillus theae]PWA06055.1 IclR family transcriptional regulator [Pueribacillus theae]